MVVVPKKLLHITVGLIVLHCGTEAKKVNSLKVHKKLKVGGKSTFKDDVTMRDDLLVAGNVSCGDQDEPADVTVSGNLVLTGNTSTTGDILIGNQLLFNFRGLNNSYVGISAGNITNTANGNSGFGVHALLVDTTGSQNSAYGTFALSNNTTGNNNEAFGFGSLQNNVSGFDNVAVGALAANQNTSGSGNTAVGNNALITAVSGSNSTAIGLNALQNALGSNNIALGAFAGAALVNGNENVIIAHPGFDGESGVIRIGLAGSQEQAFIAGVRNVQTGINDGIAVLIDSQGQLGTVSSTKKVKENICNIGDISSLLLKLRPVKFNYIADEGKLPQYGLIAEEVAEIYPELVVFDEDGNPYTVKYHLLYALMLNEIQRCHRIIEDHENALALVDEKMEEVITNYVTNLQSLLARISALEQLQNIAQK